MGVKRSGEERMTWCRNMNNEWIRKNRVMKMNNKNKLRNKIKQDMIDLQNRLDKLNFWEESGYADKPCVEHEWTLVHHQALATPTIAGQ